MPPGAEQRARPAAEAALVGGVVLAYLWLFRRYGFDVVDEGTLLAQIDRAASGARPYLDFETGYTPGYFLLYGALWRLGGLVALRTFGIALQAAAAALLYALARRRAGRAIACLAVLTGVAFLLPVSMRAGAPFDIPYPGWLVAPLALVIQALALRSLRGGRGGRAAAAAAGVAAGLAFSVKPSGGLLLLAGAALAAPLGWSASGPGARRLAAALRVAAPAAAAALLWDALGPYYGLAVLGPVAAAALAADPDRGSPIERAAKRPLAGLLLLGLGFLVPVLPWAAPLAAELGPIGFLRGVLLLGGGVVDAYLLPFPAPEPATISLVSGLLAAAAAARAAPRLAPVALGAGALGAFALAADPRLAAENALPWLAVGATYVGLAARDRSERALHVVAALQLVQLFPRPDLVHLAQIGPPLLLAAATTWGRGARAWREGLADRAIVRRWVPRAVAAAVALLSLGRLAPSLLDRLVEPLRPLELGPRAPVVATDRGAAELAWLERAVADLERIVPPGAPVFAFPDLAGAVFLAGRPQPFTYLYYVPGRPDRSGEARALTELERLRPPVAIVGPPRVPAFAAAPSYFRSIAAYLDVRYREVASGPGYRVLVRRREAAP